MLSFCCGSGALVWQNKNPTAGLAMGFDKSGQRIRTQPPRDATAARSAADSDSDYDSRRQDNNSTVAGQIDFHACLLPVITRKLV
jgi:hypothetical protein